MSNTFKGRPIKELNKEQGIVLKKDAKASQGPKAPKAYWGNPPSKKQATSDGYMVKKPK